jgi:hypothetical protein
MATKYIVNNVSGQKINDQLILPTYKVYTAIIRQSGTSTESSISAGTLTIGVTYRINQISVGMDFTNVGAPNNNDGTYFVATGTTPNSWGEGADYTLAYDEGAPIVTVLENTLGYVWFSYNYAGEYILNSTNLFTNNKTFTYIGSDANFDPAGNPVPQTQITSNDYTRIDIKTFTIDADGYGVFADNLIVYGTPIEIRVYN